MWESGTYLDQYFQLRSSGFGKKTGLEPDFRTVGVPLVKIQSCKTEDLTLCWRFNSARDSVCLSVAQGGRCNVDICHKEPYGGEGGNIRTGRKQVVLGLLRVLM